MIRAVFFDLDETLIDATQCHADADAEVFKRFGINYHDIETHTSNHDFVGMRVNEMLKVMRDSVGVTDQQLPMPQLINARQEIFLEQVRDHAKLLPGAGEAMRAARTSAEQVAIVSSGTRRYIQQVLDQFVLNDLVDFFVGEEDVQRGKPFPDPYQTAFERLPAASAIQKPETLVVEDSVNGVKSAQAAGLPVLFVPFMPDMRDLTFPNVMKISSLIQFDLSQYGR